MFKKKIITSIAYAVKKYPTCFFAITNFCNARCDFCNIWKQSGRFPDIADVKKAIDNLYRLNIRLIQFTGGEPLLYPHIFEAIRHASMKGILISMATNGSLITRNTAKKLKKSGINHIGISLDHYKKDIYEKNKKIPDLLNKVRNAVTFLKKEKVSSEAFILINRHNYRDMKKTIEFAESLGFVQINLCYPMNINETTFTLGGSSVDFSGEELIEIFSKVKEMKRQGYRINNPTEALNNNINFIRGKNVRYPCFGGYKIFYLDWNLDLYKCMNTNEKITNVLHPDGIKIKKQKCNKCMLQCFRDLSIYYSYNPIKSNLKVLFKHKAYRF